MCTSPARKNYIYQYVHLYDVLSPTITFVFGIKNSHVLEISQSLCSNQSIRNFQRKNIKIDIFETPILKIVWIERLKGENVEKTSLPASCDILDISKSGITTAKNFCMNATFTLINCSIIYSQQHKFTILENL